MKTITFVLLSILCSVQICAQYGTSAGSMSYTRQYGNSENYNRRGLHMPDESTFIVRDFVNYHKHNITIPEKDDVALSIDYDNNIPGNENEFILQIGLATQPANKRSKQQNKVNVTLVMDVSGSMSGNKIEQVKRSMKKFIRSLNNGDYLSVVLFNSEASVLLPATYLRTDRRYILELIDNLSSGGYTNLNDGMMLGYKETVKYHSENVNSRLILLTDGLTNRGEKNQDKIIRNSLDYNREGINISTIGVGESLDFDLLRQLADKGKGSNYFLGDSGDDIEKVFDEELESLLYNIGSDPCLTVDLPTGWTIKECYGYDPEYQRSNKLSVSFDNLNASSTRVILMKVQKDTRCNNNTDRQIVASLSYRKDEGVLNISKKMLYSDKTSHTNKEISKNFDIAYMAVSLKKAAREYANNNLIEAEKILTRTNCEVRNSEYSSDKDFKRVYDILRSYCSLTDKDEL
ncbi:VWA domain-containing protein [Dysgonomonas sp. OttesenSCG-928-M03]|nr:VWA domain-containing protein [Dysgonomonas sp. OttesenSCG-928-M03]